MEQWWNYMLQGKQKHFEKKETTVPESLSAPQIKHGVLWYRN